MTKNPSKRATVSRNQNFFQFQTTSIGMLNFAEPNAPFRYRGLAASDQEIGNALRQSLADSRMVSMDEFQKIWKEKDLIIKRASERDLALMEQYGYRNKRELYKQMDICWISLQEGKIKIQPTHHKSLDHYTGISIDGPEILYISEGASDEELGRAVKEGLNRCTSSIKK